MSRMLTSGGPTLASPRWAGDYFDRNALIPGGAKVDPTQFLAEDATTAVVDTAGAAANATTIPLKAALAAAIPSGTALYFGASKKLALTTAAAAAGATSLTVQALPTALVDGDTATYAGAGTGQKLIKSGTLLGRTITERDAHTGFGPWASGDDEVFLLAFDVTDFSNNADCELYRHNRIVKENKLPGWSSLWTSGMKTALRSAYTCVNGG